MIPISEIFQKKFQGISYFYVDDSVIFTNDVKGRKNSFFAANRARYERIRDLWNPCPWYG